MTYRFPILLFLLVALLGVFEFKALADEAAKPVKNTTLRRYREGPLRLEDFRGRKPDRAAGDKPVPDALTATDINYTYSYKYETKGNKTSVWLSEFDIYATIDRSRSWNSLPEDRELLDHEQGHFDITHAIALSTKLKLRKKIKEGRALNTSGSSVNDALGKLDRKLKESIGTVSSKIQDVHDTYDRVTQHGLQKVSQRLQRKQQLEEIKKLTEALSRLDSR